MTQTAPPEARLSQRACLLISAGVVVLAALVGFLVWQHHQAQEEARHRAEWVCAMTGQGGGGSIYSEEFLRCVDAQMRNH
jgi:hypothetical protein